MVARTLTPRTRLVKRKRPGPGWMRALFEMHIEVDKEGGGKAQCKTKSIDQQKDLVIALMTNEGLPGVKHTDAWLVLLRRCFFAGFP